jgi:hypothetical protein
VIAHERDRLCREALRNTLATLQKIADEFVQHGDYAAVLTLYEVLASEAIRHFWCIGLVFRKRLHLTKSDVAIPRLTTFPTWVLNQRSVATHTYCPARFLQRKYCVGETARGLVSERDLLGTMEQSKTRVFRVCTQVDESR